jgi:DNA-binding transcriptional LysR family regulator
MKMHQIKYFLALCKERSFMRAAKNCGVSQPSLTNGIKALEKELGGDLFARRPRIALTPLGFAVRPRLMRIVQDAENVLETARCMRRTSAEPSLPATIAHMTPAEQFTVQTRPNLDVAIRGQAHRVR